MKFILTPARDCLVAENDRFVPPFYGTDQPVAVFTCCNDVDDDDVHGCFGGVVRVLPNELFFRDPGILKGIRETRAGLRTMRKAPLSFRGAPV